VWSDGTSYCCCATDQICAGGQRRASGVGFYAVGVQLQLILATKHKREFCAQGVYDPCVLGNRDVQVGSKLRPYSASEETMVRELLPKSLLILILSVLALPVTIALYGPQNVSAQTEDAPGALTVIDGNGKQKAVCPLKHTDVKAEISGFISRVVVTQQFENPFKEKIEAVYTFPLPQNAVVDDMTMIVGDGTVRGKILPREEAQAIYEAAKSGGQVASLLDQERANIFTQSVANILPGEQVKITISYVETLSYVNGAYEFVFPMVVGPRYIPGTPKDQSQSNGSSPDTNHVPDASRITPRAAPAGVRSGHDISLEVALDAGLIIDNIDSKTHPTDIQRPDAHSARLRLKNEETIPNKDFILRYDVAGQAIQ